MSGWMGAVCVDSEPACVMVGSLANACCDALRAMTGLNARASVTMHARTRVCENRSSRCTYTLRCLVRELDATEPPLGREAVGGDAARGASPPQHAPCRRCGRTSSCVWWGCDARRRGALRANRRASKRSPMFCQIAVFFFVTQGLGWYTSATLFIGKGNRCVPPKALEKGHRPPKALQKGHRANHAERECADQ